MSQYLARNIVRTQCGTEPQTVVQSLKFIAPNSRLRLYQKIGQNAIFLINVLVGGKPPATLKLDGSGPI